MGALVTYSSSTCTDNSCAVTVPLGAVVRASRVRTEDLRGGVRGLLSGVSARGCDSCKASTSTSTRYWTVCLGHRDIAVNNGILGVQVDALGAQRERRRDGHSA
eukprot:Colp12_sorted_trinity150504_noHs@3158